MSRSPVLAGTAPDARQDRGAVRRRCRWRGGVLILVVVVVWGAVLISSAPDRFFGWGGKGRFFDLRGTLAAAELAHDGGNPYAINPLDPAGRPHLYSSWWLALGRILDRTDTDRLGITLVAVLLVAALASWWPRNVPEAAIELALLVSPAWLLAVYRANNDVVIFAGLAVAIAWFARADSRLQIAAAALTGALAILKYFPVAAALGCLTARRRVGFLALLGVLVGTMAVGYPSIAPALAVVGRYAPRAFGLHTFGATMLLTALPASWPMLLRALIAVMMALVGWWAGAVGATAEPDAQADRSWLAAAVSAAVVVACFGIGSSFTYKAVFLWWLARWLARDARVKIGRARAFGLLGLLVALCWADGITALLLNIFVPGLSLAGRRIALAGVHLEMSVVQLAWWCLIGACARVAFDWARARLKQLS